MKLKLLLLLTMCMVILPSLMAGFSYEYNGNKLIYEVIDEESKTCRVVGAQNLIGQLFVPECAVNGLTDYTVTEIGKDAFMYNTGITSAIISNSVISISEWAFYGCSELRSIIIPKSVSSICKCAFYECKSLISIDIPNSVTFIGDAAFAGCSELKSMVIPNSITSIGWGTFMECRNLSSVKIPNSVTSICSSAFQNCSGLVNIEIPNSVTSIEAWAFSGCSRLTSLKIPDSVISIGNSAFKDCTGIISLVIGKSVEKIETNAFDNCNSIVEIEYHAKNCILATKEDYMNSSKSPFRSSSSLKTLIIGDEVNSIPSYAFDRCRNLTSITIGNSLTEIGKCAFYDCCGLTSVEIPNSVIQIGQQAFYHCSGLTSIVIPNSVTSIGWGAFENCSIDTIILGYGVKEIGSRGFSDCPVSNIYITAQTPPTIQFDTFSNYHGKLWIQGNSAMNAYSNIKYWVNFSSEVMTEPTEIRIGGPTEIIGKVGDCFKLTADIIPMEVTLPYILWRSTDPNIATVNYDGTIKLMEFKDDFKYFTEEWKEKEGICKIIAESLYFNGPIAEVTVKNTGFAAVESMSIHENSSHIDYSQPYEVYNLNGVKFGEAIEGLAKGIYVVRQGSKAVKVSVK